MQKRADQRVAIVRLSEDVHQSLREYCVKNRLTIQEVLEKFIRRLISS